MTSDMTEDAVEAKDYVSEDLDQVIPKHQLLDNTAAKHKNELVHRGTLATRHRPTGEGLRTQILRRQHADSKEGSPVSSKCDLKSDFPQLKSKNPSLRTSNQP